MRSGLKITTCKLIAMGRMRSSEENLWYENRGSLQKTYWCKCVSPKSSLRRHVKMNGRNHIAMQISPAPNFYPSTRFKCTWLCPIEVQCWKWPLNTKNYHIVWPIIQLWGWHQKILEWLTVGRGPCGCGRTVLVYRKKCWHQRFDSLKLFSFVRMK